MGVGGWVGGGAGYIHARECGATTASCGHGEADDVEQGAVGPADEWTTVVSKACTFSPGAVGAQVQTGVERRAVQVLAHLVRSHRDLVMGHGGTPRRS